MSLIPAFKIGLLNGWIFVLPLVLGPLLWRLIVRGRANKSPSTVPLNKTEKKFNILGSAIFFLAIIYSVFLPLRLGTIWFYIGLPVFLLASIMLTIIILNWVRTPAGEPVTGGLYRYSRHPIYIAVFLLFLSIGIACASWVYLLCAIAHIIVQSVLVVSEERFCLEVYGDAYRAYMAKTPRWIGIPKSEGK